MCLIVFALDAHPDFWLVLAGNRDEMFARPTAPASFWKEDSGAEWFGGRDLERGGTWLGLSKSSRIAAVTNVRDPSAHRDGGSRGWLTRDALTSPEAVEGFARAIDRPHYPAFNLLLGDGKDLYYARDDDEAIVRVRAGLHGLSNHRLDTYWPKVEIGLRRLNAVLERPATPSPDALFDLLADKAIAEDGMLPHTGVPLEIERALSAAFVRTPVYGSRCSTVVLWHKSGSVYFEERSFDASGANVSTVVETLQLPGPPQERPPNGT